MPNQNVATRTDSRGVTQYVALSDNLSGYNAGGFGFTRDVSKAVRFTGTGSDVIQPKSTLEQFLRHRERSDRFEGYGATWNVYPLCEPEIELAIGARFVALGRGAAA